MADPIPGESNLAIPAAAVAEDIGALLQLFPPDGRNGTLDEARYCAGIVGFAVLMLLLARFLIGRRVKRMEALDDKHFSPLRWQAQDLMSSEDMKLF